MAHTPPQYIVNRGVLANDGAGDSLRDAFGKLNEAVEALYGADLGTLSNIDTTGAVTGNTLIYNAVTGNWEASSTVAASALNDLTDVTTVAPLNAGMVLRYNGATFINTVLTTADVTEDPTNLYYTLARDNSAFDTRLATKSTANLSEDPSATVSSGTMYYTDARVNTAFDTRLATKSTADLPEDPAATGSSGTMYYTDARADARVAIGISNLIDGAPAALDTLNEIAEAINDDASYAATITTELAGKEPTITATTTADYYRGDKTFVTLNTDAVPESGSPTNLWYTTARSNADFDTRLATKSTANLAEDPAATNSSGTAYYTTTRHDTDFDTRLATKSTADVAEDPAATVSSGTMYYTDARVDTRIAATNIGSLNNVDTTGVANNSILRYSTGSSSWVISATSDPVVVVGQETITGANGVLTAFTMSTVAPTTNTAIVSVNGIIQEPTTAYSISGSTITFTSPPPNGARIGIRALGSGEQGFVIRSADFNAVATGRYGVDTSGGIVTATLPASPSAGEAIYFMDAGGAYSSNTFTVDRNGNTINGAASNLAKTTNGESFGLMYTGSTWRTY